MKKFFLLTMASLMTVFAMAIGRNDGSTKANAIDFDWDKGHEQDAGTKWYRVGLEPLYEEENPSLTLYLTNPSNVVGSSVDVKFEATVAGQTESDSYKIAARQYKTFTANAKLLVTLQQNEIYVTLTSSGKVKFSAKVFESADLDETCKDAEKLPWYTAVTQQPMFSKWWKIDISQIKDTTIMKKDAKVTITNTGTKEVTLKAGQSLDCPSSGLTRRTYTLAPGESVFDTIPQSMIMSVQPDEIYFGLENVESEITIRVDTIAKPKYPIIPASAPFEDLNVTDTIENLTGTHYFRVKVADMDSLAKYEPEFTYRNVNSTDAKVTVKMAFEVPAFGTSNTVYDLASGQEEIVVYKKNMLASLDGVEYIYLLTEVTGYVNFYGRFKHVREGKACKTNIDFNWADGHTQEERTSQWYALDVAEARNNFKDIIVYVANQGTNTAKVTGSLAFSCPYIDVQEITRNIAKGDTAKHRLAYSTYAMMPDTVWVGLETSQNLKFWAEMVDTKKKAEVDSACVKSETFNWDEGVYLKADTVVWYRVDMNEVRDRAAKFPTVYVQNMSSNAAAVVTAELSVECPDSIENQKRSTTIPANGTYSKQMSRNLFENIVQDEIYLRVHSTQDISIQIRLTEEAEGASCASAIPFNWVSGNSQAAGANLWYVVDLREVMANGNDIALNVENRDDAAGKATVGLAFTCPSDEVSTQDVTIKAKETRKITIQNSTLDALTDSVVYINVSANVALRAWIDTLARQPFDTITGEGITLTPLMWDSTYTLNTDTAWYVIPESEIAKVRNAEDKVKPVAHLYNLSTYKNSIKAEAAFAFPIVKAMMSKTQKLEGGRHTTDTVQVGLFDQFLKKDSVIIRVTRPVGTGAFQFRAELIKAWSGNDRKDAIPLALGKQIGQSANSSIWYKVKTADWKKNTTLYNKSMRIFTKNAGTTTAKITVEAYDGYNSDVNLLDGQGSIKSPSGEVRQKSFPAQVIYGLGDVEVYFRITTTDTLVFSTEVTGEYAPKPVDPAQDSATLLVPNVTYTIPGDNQEHWYRVCVPYIRNNFKYVHAATLTYELDGKATIEGTATLSDNLNFAMPVRKRTINKSGKHYKGEKQLSELIAKAVKKGLDRDLDITTFKENYVDSMLRRYVTSDSISMYVRIKTDKEIKARLNMLQITGDDCLNPMEFDWEHGNVSEEGRLNIIHVKMDSTRVPKGKDLLLHMDNWGTDSTKVTAKFYEEGCPFGAELGSIGRKIATDTTKLLAREIIETWGWSGLMIQYQSDSATHVWAELVDKAIPDTLRDTTAFTICAGEEAYGYTINKDTVWETMKDSIDKSEMIYYIYVHRYEATTLRDVKLVEIDSLKNLPAVAPGAVLDFALATAELDSIFAAQGDTVKVVGTGDSIKWECTLDGENFQAIPATPLTSGAIGLRYIITTQCDDQDTSKTWINIPEGTLTVNNCGSYTWSLNGKEYTKSSHKQDSVHVAIPGTYLDSAVWLDLTVYDPLPNDTTHAGTQVGSYKWEVNGQTYTETPTSPDGMLGYDVDTVYGQNGQCDTIYVLELTIIPEECTKRDTLPADTACKSYTWSVTGETYTATGYYSDTTKTAQGCDSIVTLDLTIITTVYDTIVETTAQCNEYKWAKNGKSYYETGLYNDTVTASATECDTIYTLNVTINHPKLFNLKAVSRYGNRLLIIHRNDIIENTGWQLDSIYDEHGPVKVYWYKTDGTTDTKVGEGYFYNLPNGDPLVGTFYATVEIPAIGGCGYKGETQKLVCGVLSSAAPALIPNLVRGGEEIRVVNLDPEQETTIRIYTTEGLVKENYTVSGQETFTIKAAGEHGFYLVELRNEDIHSTLRYIVK